MTAAACATLTIRWRTATSPSQATIWRTPEPLFRALDQEFRFTIDVAADDGNAVVDRYLDAARDALEQPWHGETVFCNPPYGRDLARWLEKAVVECQEHGSTVVMLLPARTGNAWFHRYCLRHGEVRFIKGRQNFHLGGAGRSNAPFDSMVVVFRPDRAGAGTFTAQPTFPFYT